jgi:HPt (histidine-containing phosphotransfer) domain-containing protein
METPEEKIAYLNEAVGQGGYRQDAVGRFIITQEGRNRLKMGQGPEVSIDEEGLSFGDVKEFLGQAGLPIVAGVGASLMSSGLGFVPGALMVAGASATGKLVDEAIESAEGLQRQTLPEIGRDAAFEGAFALLGEGVGRGISNLFGRIIKGPGGEANEALRTEAREMLKRGIRPTIAGATSADFRPILNRLQAVYEGVFPNQKAAQNNLDILLKELRETANVGPNNLKDFERAVQNDIDAFYGSSANLLADAQKQLDAAIEGEINNVMKPLMKGEDVSKELADALQLRKSLFDEKVDQIYTTANRVLDGKEIISTKGVKDALRQVDEDFAADILTSKLGREISGLGDYITPARMQQLRKKLTEATGSPDIVNNASYGALTRLKSAVNDSFMETQLRMQQTVNMMKEGAGMQTPGATKGLTGLMTGEQATIQNMGLAMETIADGLDLLTRANRLYGIGMRRFDNPVTMKIIKKARDGQINMPFIYEQIIAKDNPEALGQLFRAIRGVPDLEIVDLADSARFAGQQKIFGMDLEEALETIKDLPKNNRRRRAVEMEIERIERSGKARSAIRGTGAEAAEELRRRLGSMYLKDVLEKSRLIETSTGAKVVDPIILARELKKKGTTINRLFSKEKSTLDDLVKILETGRAEIAPEVLDALPNLPLKQQMEALKKATVTQKDISRSQIYRAFEAGDTEQIAKLLLSKPSAVDDAKKALSPELFEQAKDQSMGRILRQIGATVEDGGEIRLQGNFLEDFQSGRLGKNLQSVLESYGESHIDKLFGPKTYNSLFTIADDMTRASNAAIAGKGGLAAPQIALTLGVVGFITNPVATLATGAGYAAMSKLLRKPEVLRAMMASRKKLTVKEFLQGKRKTQDPVGQGLQAVLQITSQAGFQTIRGNVGQAKEELEPST